MSSYVHGYTNLGPNFLTDYKKKGDSYLTPEKKQLKGFGRALAIATLLYDFDCLGNSGTEMGYVLSSEGATLTKIGGSEALPFLSDFSSVEGIKHKPSSRDMIVGTNGRRISFDDVK